MIMLQQMLVLFFLMLLGIVEKHTGIIDNRNMKQLSAMVVNVANPALIISGCIGDAEKIRGNDLKMAVIVAVGMYLVLLGISRLAASLLRAKEEERAIYQLQMIFSNVGFMGIPIVAAVYGTSAILYVTIFLIPYNILIYTYGVGMISGNSGQKSPGAWKQTLKNIFNSGTIASILAILMYATDLRLPYIFEKTISMVSNLAAPISMMIIGATLADMNLKELFTDLRLLLFSAIKLLLLPVAAVLFLRIFIANRELLGVTMVMLATPAGSMTAMLAQQYGRQTELASKGVALTTLLSVLTMPIVSMFVA